MQEINIRKATLADIPILLQFEQDLIITERPFDPTLRQPPIAYYNLPEMVAGLHIELVVAEDNGTIVACGYARIETAMPYLQHRQYAYLGFMYTHPAYRGKGINKIIIDTLKSWSAAQGITELRLEVYHDNAPAIKAYEKAGFILHKTEMRMPL